MKKKSCDHRETMYGKGDLRRPTDHKKFGDNYDRIFGKKEAKRG